MPQFSHLTRRLFLGQAAVSLLSLSATAKTLVPEEEFYVFEAREGLARLLPEPAPLTRVWGYNGEVPGPLLRVKPGEEVKVRLVNKLPQPTTLSWHGLRLPNAMAGIAGLSLDPVAPGESFEYRFTPKESGLSWYHPHVLAHNSEQIGRGLHGVLIVDEAKPPIVDKELLVVIEDWKLDEDAQIIGDFHSLADARGRGRIGPLVTVNAQPLPVPEILPPGSRLRLRIVSALCARIMLLTFEGANPLILAVDGQPCEAFEPVRQTIPVGPGARFDIMLDLPAEDGTEASLILRGDAEPDRVLMTFKTEGKPREPLPPIESLPENLLLPAVIRLEKAYRLDITFAPIAREPEPAALSAGRPALWTINGQASEGFPRKPLFSVKRGSPVSLGFINRTGFVQQIRVHGHMLRLLHDLDDGWEPYWRDAILVPDGRTRRVAFVADNPGRWPIECLMTAGQARGLATWFEVT
jgi:FtsP/CotA-like multicopper oxidase with cupredoxin domain